MFDTFVLHALIDEINKNVLSYRLQRIISPGPMSLILRFRKDLQIFFSLDPSRCYATMISSEQKESDSPTPFSQYLKKSLQGARLLGVRQRAFDRVMEIHFLASTPTMDRVELKLIIELMGRHSNVIVTDAQDMILQALRYTPHLSESPHVVRIGRQYIDMPTGKENPLTSELPSSRYKEVGGFTPKLMRLLPGQIKEQSLSEIANWLLTQHDYALYVDEDKKAYDFHRFSNDSLQYISYPTISSLIEAYYQALSRRESSGAYKRRFEQMINTRLERVERKLQKQRQELDQAKDAHHLKEAGDILFAHLYSLPKRAASVEVHDFYHDRMRVIELNEKFTISQNAQRYYKNYEKAQRANKIIESQLKKSQEEYERLEQLRYELSITEGFSDIREIEQALIAEGYLPGTGKKTSQAPSKPRKFIYEGVTYLVGKNASQNNDITFRQPQRDFLWFHAKDIPGSHVVLQQSEDKVTDDQLLFGAKLAAYFSKEPKNKIEVDVTQLKYVKKIRGSSLGKVTYTNHRTIITQGSAEDIFLHEKK